MQSTKTPTQAPDPALLKRLFGLDQFRPFQAEALTHVLEKRDVLLLLPTGGGKSLVYQYVAGLQEGLVLVVSPLIALMDDQVLKTEKLGLRGRQLHSGLDKMTREARLKEVAEGKVDILFVTPERFRKPEFREVLGELVAQGRLRLMAVDESHCISQWGHDFRPDYSRLGEIRAFLGNPPTIALTATATVNVQNDILKSLNMEGATLVRAPMHRPNLGLYVHDVYGWDEKIRGIFGLCHQVTATGGGSVVVYTALINSLYKVKRELERLGLAPLMYHGQLNPGQRRKTLRDFMADDNAIMLATPAFGLGIDKPNIRCVIHAEIPGSVESYFQEVGRAGRDGLPATGQLLLDQDDLSIQEEFVKWANPEESVIEHVYRLIEKRDPDLDQRGFDYLREMINFYNKRDYRAEAAVAMLERWGCLAVASDLRFPYVAVGEPGQSEFSSMKTDTRRRVTSQKLYQLAQMLETKSGCRQQDVLAYFGESIAPCGVCDLCLAKGTGA